MVLSVALTGSDWTWIGPENLGTIHLRSVALHPNNPDVVIAGSKEQGILKFTGSRSWNPVRAGDTGTVLIDPSNPSTVYAIHVEGGPGELLRSDDDGMTWADKRRCRSGDYCSGTRGGLIDGIAAAGGA